MNERGNGVAAVRAGRKLDDDDDSPANSQQCRVNGTER
jgi:hypothetical protein